MSYYCKQVLTTSTNSITPDCPTNLFTIVTRRFPFNQHLNEQFYHTSSNKKCKSNHYKSVLILVHGDLSLKIISTMIFSCIAVYARSVRFFFLTIRLRFFQLVNRVGEPQGMV